MAAEADQCISLANRNLSANAIFERKVTERLNWSRRKWTESGEAESRFHKMINSIRFWSEKLAKAQGDTNVILGLFHEDKDITLNLTEMMEAFDKIGVGDKIIGFTSFRNPKYMCFSFSSAETKRFVENNMRTVGDCNVVYLNWAFKEKSKVIKFHWVPMEIPIVDIISVISEYATVENFVREENMLMNGRMLKNGTVVFNVILKENVEIKNIPHLCLVNGLELLVNITGRQLLCLNCSLLGHKSSECPTPYCGKCKKMCPKLHTCVVPKNIKKSYAQVVNSDVKDLIDASKEGTFEASSVVEDVNKFSGERDKNIWMTAERKVIAASHSLPGSEDRDNGKGLGSWSWTAGEEENTVDLEFDDDISDNDQAAVSKIDDYFKELQALKKAPIVMKPAEKATDLELENLKDLSPDDRQMDLDPVQLKRKIDNGRESKPSRGTNNKSRITYGGRGRGGEAHLETLRVTTSFKCLLISSPLKFSILGKFSFCFIF